MKAIVFKTLTFAYLTTCLFGVLAVSARAQGCALKIGAWESDPAVTRENPKLFVRKGTVTKFTSTAINQKSRKSYKGVVLFGYAYYENIPEGDYRITVRKLGFKTTIQPYNFSCKYASNGVDFLDILVFRGNSTETFVSERTTRLGSLGADLNPPPLGWKAPPKIISGGVLNGKAISLPLPAYPAAARAVKAGGSVSVQVLIDENGNVISASAVGGHPLLRDVAVSAAKEAKFAPVTLSGVPVKVSGVIAYNFVP